MMLCVLDEENEDKVIKRFQQTIFGQDKPILETSFRSVCRSTRAPRRQSAPTSRRSPTAVGSARRA